MELAFVLSVEIIIVMKAKLIEPWKTCALEQAQAQPALAFLKACASLVAFSPSAALR